MYRHTAFFFSFVFLATALTPVHASRFALVIGNADYQNVASLKNPVNDATDMATVLKSLGFEVVLKHNADMRTMVNAVQGFGTRLRNGDVGLFYYAGHGLQLRGSNLLVPIGTQIKTGADIEFEAFDVQRVLAQMEHANNNGVNIVILDACRDNPYKGRFISLERSLVRGLARIDSPIGTLIAYATAPGEVAIDGRGRNGTFTKHLLWALRTIPHLSVTDLLTEVTGKVVEETSRLQVPWQSVSLTQRFCFAQCEVVPSCANNTFAPGKAFREGLRDGSLGPEMVWIAGGRFQMGDLQGNGFANERPVHWISVDKFAMGRYEVTFAEYDKFAQATGRDKPDDKDWGRGNRPVINVSLEDAIAYTEWLSQQTGQTYRLPTEAEWENAARAGTTTDYWWGNKIGSNRANCKGCGSQWDAKRTAEVGSFDSNAFGLYDTVGNIWEWTCSEYEEKYRGKEQRCADKESTSSRVLRGGSWYNPPKGARVSYRDRDWNSWWNLQGFVGFRLLREFSIK
jgi:formylglycine-generating enzyme required for sulfatase activity